MIDEMQEIKELTTFFTAIKNDTRIGISHVTLYMALFQFYNVSLFHNPIEITRIAVMEIAKISGLGTYHKCIKDLHEFGYIHYLPSCNPGVRSLVFLLKI